MLLNFLISLFFPCGATLKHNCEIRFYRLLDDPSRWNSHVIHSEQVKLIKFFVEKKNEISGLFKKFSGCKD